MEVYFENLTNDTVSVEKLVDDLACLANDVEVLVKATRGNLGQESQQELLTAMQRIKARCESIRQNALVGLRATDRTIRRHPYLALGAVLGLGFLLGALASRSRSGPANK
jgi:ElaB/YqjD/DUF883 family membrane-anchored ribosome-binding protein